MTALERHSETIERERRVVDSACRVAVEHIQDAGGSVRSRQDVINVGASDVFDGFYRDVSGKAHRFAERRRIGCSGFDFGVAARESQDFLGTFIDFTVKEAAVVVVAVKGALTRGLEHRDHFREVGIGRIARSVANAV